MAAYGRKRTVISLIFEPTERPLLVKADIEFSIAENPCWMTALPSKADVELVLVLRAATDPKRTVDEAVT